MINFAELQELSSIATNTTANGVGFREITTEQVRDALIGDALDRTSKLEINEQSGTGRVAGKSIALKYLTESGEYNFFQWLEFKVAEHAQHIRLAAEKSDTLDFNTRIQAAVNYCYGLQTIMSAISRNAYYRHLEAVRMEEPGADRRTSRPNDYDGFQNVKFSPDQVIDAVGDIFGTYDDVSNETPSFHMFYTCFNMLSGNKAVSPHLVAGREQQNGERFDFLTVDEVWTALERKRMERVANLPTREQAVAAM